MQSGAQHAAPQQETWSGGWSDNASVRTDKAWPELPDDDQLLAMQLPDCHNLPVVDQRKGHKSEAKSLPTSSTA
eukprot:11105250-Karenia_brevis.AAC.1